MKETPFLSSRKIPVTVDHLKWADFALTDLFDFCQNCSVQFGFLRDFEELTRAYWSKYQLCIEVDFGVSPSEICPSVC